MDDSSNLKKIVRNLPDERNVLHTLIYGEIESIEHAQKIVDTTSNFLLLFCGIAFIFALNYSLVYVAIILIIFFFTIFQKKWRSYLLGLLFVTLNCLLVYLDIFENPDSFRRGRMLPELAFLVLLSIRSLYAIHYLKFYKKNSAN